MKKWIILIVIASFFGCQQQKQEIARLGTVRDSLAIAAAEKDSAIVDFLTGFNEIQANLDSIKTVEKLVSLNRGQSGELKANQKQQIIEDIRLLNQLIKKNKELTASLQQKLKNSNLKVGQLEGMVGQFEKMVASLNTQIETKNGEIVQLTEDVKRLNIDVSQLTSQVQQVTEEVQQKTEVIENQTIALNTAFFALGTVKELAENNVLEKSGGVLGIGRTLKMKKDFNRDYFTEVDIRKLSFLPLSVKKARVITVHPESSFHITGVKSADTLFIDNSQEFWKASKFLLIVID